jgi:dTDP-4-dehydrorhamnose 3,5-epimerase-like enzyme
MVLKLIKGNFHADSRGTLSYNNDFDATAIKRIYVIENKSTDFVRGWRGHQIEKRWFSAIKGSFKIELIAIDDWEHPSKESKRHTFVIYAEKMDILHVPAGFISSIQSLEDGARLLVMADYSYGELNDEYQFEVDYFK